MPNLCVFNIKPQTADEYFDRYEHVLRSPHPDQRVRTSSEASLAERSTDKVDGRRMLQFASTL